jgi:hypothetical protein
MGTMIFPKMIELSHPITLKRVELSSKRISVPVQYPRHFPLSNFVQLASEDLLIYEREDKKVH